MAMTTCPNCGKQLRPGARFCGSCGATLPAGSAGKATGTDAGSPAAGLAAVQPSADTLPCPNCGKPVRKGAKFCGQCGHTITPESAAAASSSDIAPTLAAAPTRAGVQAGLPPAADRRTPAAQPAGQRRGLPLLLLAVLAVGCLAALGGGYFVAARQGWLDGVPGGALGAQPSPTEAVSVAVTETALPAASPTSEEPPTDIPTPEPTLPPTDVPTPTLKPTLAAIEPSLPLPSPTAAASTALTGLPPTTTATVTTTASISGTTPTIELVLDDVFDGPVSANWLTWGEPIPTIDSGPGYKWLSLKADVPNTGGVTTRTGVVVVNAPGLEIEFTAAIQDRYPNSKLFMDWDPQQTRRGPELKDPGLLRVGVRKDMVTLSTLLTRQSCDAAVDGLQQHRYAVRITEGYHAELYLDDGSTPACVIEALGLEATVPGRVSFSGRGWLTHVKIMQPVVEP